MLKVKSFGMEQDKEVNDLLLTHRLAPNATILVSEGKIIIPYEDGEAPNLAQKTIEIKEQINAHKMQVGLLIHSQRVLEIQEKGVSAEIEKIDAQINIPKSKKDYELKKELEASKKNLENVLTQTRNSIIQNQAELTRLTTNIAVFEETLSKLGNDETN